jgi:hypothetical protein
MLTNEELEKVFGVPVIAHIVLLDPNKLYGFASCSDLLGCDKMRQGWQYTVGGFSYLYGYRCGEFASWELTSGDCCGDDPDAFYNGVFFEINEQKQPVGIIMRGKMDTVMANLSGQYNSIVILDLTSVEKDTYEPFEWEI